MADNKGFTPDGQESLPSAPTVENPPPYTNAINDFNSKWVRPALCSHLIEFDPY